MDGINEKQPVTLWPPMRAPSEEECPSELENPKTVRRHDFTRKRTNKHKHKKHKSLKPKIKPHSAEPSKGESIFRDHIESTLENLDVATLTHLLETLVGSQLLWNKDSKILKILFVVLEYGKLRLGSSFCTALYAYMKNSESSFAFLENWNLADFIAFLKSAVMDWTSFKSHPGFKSLFSLFTYIVTLGFVSPDTVNIDFGKFDLLHIEVLKQQINATDFIDALWKTMLFLSTSAAAIADGDWRAILNFNDSVTEFETEYFFHKTQYSYVIAGNYSLMSNPDVHLWEKRLLDAIIMGKKARKNLTGPSDTRLANYLKELEAMHANYTQLRVSGDLREAPYSYMIYGSSCVGKSTLGNFLMRYCLEVNGNAHSSEFLSTINGSDKHYSNFRSYITGVFFDDFGNMKADFCEKSPCNTLLEFVNNVPLYLIMAEVELKGKVTAQPKVVGVTTNVWDMCASTYSNEPASILRRIYDHIHVRVRPEFLKTTQTAQGLRRVELDPEKIAAKFPEVRDESRTTPYIADIWEIDIYKVEIYEKSQKPNDKKESKKNAETGDPWRLVPVVHKGFIMSHIGLKQLQSYIRDSTAEFYANQANVVRNDKLMNQPNVCQECKYACQFCECSSDSKIVHHGAKEISTWAKYVEGTNSKEFRTDLTSCMTSLLFDGKIEVNKLRQTLESHTSHAFILLLERIREVLYKYTKKHHMHDWRNWIPEWIEGTEVGTYITVKYRQRQLRTLKALDTFGNTLKFVIGGVIPFKTLPLPIASMISLLITHYLPNNVASRTLNYIALNIKIDSKAPIRSLAAFFTQDFYIRFVQPYVFVPLIRRYPGLLKIVNEKLDLVVSVKTQFQEAFMQPQVYKTVGLASFVVFPTIVAPVMMCYAIRSFYKSQVKTLESSSGAIKNTMSTIKQAYPSVWRDKIIPSFASCYTMYAGLPQLYDTLIKAHADSSTTEHSALDPTPEEIRKRDITDSDTTKFYADKFADRIIDNIPMESDMRNSEVAKPVMKNLCYFRRSDGKFSNALFLTSGFALVPHHMIEAESQKYTFVRKANPDGACRNASFDTIIGPADCLRVGDHDLAVVYVHNSGDFTNLIDLFAPSTPKVYRTGKTYYRNKEGILAINGIFDIVGSITTNNHKIDGKTVSFSGLRYKSPTNFEGMCMAPIVADDKSSYIMGVHLGGDGVVEGRAGSPTPDELKSAIVILTERSHISEIAAQGIFVKKQFGVDCLQEGLHIRSPLSALEGSRNFRVFGSTIGRAQATTKVMDTPICKTVRKLFDITESWGSPKFRGPTRDKPWLPWLTSLQDSTQPSIGFHGSDVARAVDDYMVEIEEKLNSNLEYWKTQVKPLTRDQVVNGIPNCRFIDRMEASTSVGAPLGGPKRRFLTRRVDPSGIYQDYDVLDEKFWKVAEDMETEYLSGRRCYPLFKAALKDEPTLASKDKVRVFQASPLAFQLLIRKYYLPIARFLSLNPLLSECAVGINPVSKEWEELGAFVSRFGEDRMLAIDYKKYDLRMPAQLTLAALKMLRRIAKILGYDRTAIKIMIGLAVDIAWPMCAYNGDLLMLLGSNPSGQGLTVYVNSLVNSLLHRMGFFHVYPYVKKTFRQCVALSTFGDDALSSANRWYSKFNMISLRDFLAAHDMTITMAEKTAKFTKYINFKEVDYLKRSFRKDPEFGGHVGALNELSIHKSLCSIVRSQAVSPEEVSAANLVGAADSYFLHGRKEFGKQIVKLKEISRLHDLDHMTRKLNISFDDRLKHWYEQYA